MSNEFEKKIEDLFLDKTNILQKEGLDSLIVDLYKAILKEQGGQQTASLTVNEILKFLPKFEFNEKTVGQISSEDRKQIMMFFGNKVIGKKDVKEIITTINQLTNQAANAESSKDALHNLMILKILKNLLVGSSPGPAGYAFESFMAVLLGGKQIPADVGGIVDVVVGPDKYQIKFIAPNSDVTVKRKVLQKFGARSKKSKDIQDALVLKFIIAIKKSDSQVDFYTYEHTKGEMMDDEETGSFVIRPKEYKKEENYAGSLVLDEGTFIKLSKKLESSLIQTLTETATLMDNINKFYFNNNTKAASAAITNTTNISNQLTKQTSTS